jgi:hypothetical protein
LESAQSLSLMMNTDNKQREMLPALIEHLDTLGFFRFVQPDRLEGLKARFLKKPNLWVWTTQVKRDFPADEESLVEGGVGTFLKKSSYRTLNI